MIKITNKKKLEPFILIFTISCLFGYIGNTMGVSHMVNTIFATAHNLLLNTILFIMGITVLSGALSELLSEFGVVNLLEILLEPLMKPVYNLPGRCALAGIMTFFSDNPAIIAFAKEPKFQSGFKKWQLVSLTNFGTAFGMGLIVVTYMATLELPKEESAIFPAMIGLVGALIGSVISTRLMQRMVKPLLKDETIQLDKVALADSFKKSSNPGWLRVLNSLLNGGKTGVDLAISVIPGVVIISSLVMILTFGPGEQGYNGSAFQGVALLPLLASKIDFIFYYLFGFNHAELIAFPVTSMGAVGAAISMVPPFIKQGMMSGNEVAVFTAIGMCYSGFLSTHTAMLDALGYRQLTSKAILSHSIGGLMAGVCAHYLYLIFI